jgi:hypothetical protein
MILMTTRALLNEMAHALLDCEALSDATLTKFAKRIDGERPVASAAD